MATTIPLERMLTRRATIVISDLVPSRGRFACLAITPGLIIDMHCLGDPPGRALARRVPLADPLQGRMWALLGGEPD